MKIKLLLALLFLTNWVGYIFNPSSASPTITYIVYTDALSQGWQNWSWAQVNLEATAPVHSGSKSIAVTFGAWEGLYLAKAGADTSGATHLRFYLHGGTAGGQTMNVFLNLVVNGQGLNGPALTVTPPAAGAWSEVMAPLATLNPANAIITGITWQDSSGHSQQTLYVDDISFTSLVDPAAPQLSLGILLPRSVPADGITILIVRAKIIDPQGPGDIAAVSLDASALGRGTVILLDDGRSNDGVANDGVYGAVLTAAPGTPPGEYRLAVTARDQAGHSESLPLGALNILAAPGGSIPAVLPQRIGWGSNAWSETAGQDWQVNSGVPWDYVYQYITDGWEDWGPNFVYRFVHQAWDKNFIPMVTVYMVLGTPPDCGETATCYAEKLQNPAFVQAYLASLRRAAQQANGSRPVIFNLEPDFYGYMQQLSNDPANRPPGVRADDPSSYPVALNQTGYSNTLVGFGCYLVDLLHDEAPNALAAPMASAWSTNGDPQSATGAEAVLMARRTAAFIDAMGGAQADLLIVEWSDRDAGSGLRPWWDDQDLETPRPTRAILWENALSQAAHKRLLLWQVPVGNMALDNTCNHYRDNRAAYLLTHPRDLFDAGVSGVLFGGGATCMTGVETDGGFVASQGAIAYDPPGVPVGLTAGTPSSASVPLQWSESTAPDLWGYRLVYHLPAQGLQLSLDVGRRNATNLLLPYAGAWEIRIQAYDAMGKTSPLSAPVMATTFTGASRIYLPLIR